MRIISGKFKGRKIPDSMLRQTRPTTDFARTGLFNMIAHRSDLQEAEALDLFAGTGSIGFELLSRGCSHVTFVDSDKQSILHLKKTAGLLDVKNVTIVPGDVFRFLKTCKPVFHLVFADPPFDCGQEFYDTLLKMVMNKALRKDGIFILEHQATESFEAHPCFREARRFGNVAFSFFAEISES